MLFVTRLGKNLISIATIFELKYYTGNFGTTSFPENKGWIVHLVKYITCSSTPFDKLIIPLMEY